MAAVISAEHLAEQRRWSTETFGPGSRTEGICDHIKKELLEIKDDPTDVKEWVDILILGFDGAWRCGADPQEIIDAYHAKSVENQNRIWPDWQTAPEGVAIEHVRGTNLMPEARAAEGFVKGSRR